MPDCSFCKREMPFGTGVTLVKNDGRLLHFCSSKCEKNTLKLHRKPANLKWASKKVKK